MPLASAPRRARSLPGPSRWLALAAAAAVTGCFQPGEAGPPPGPAQPLHAHPGDCRVCHDTLAGGVPAAPPPEERCAGPACHRILEQRPRLVHGPVATGECRICHAHHSSSLPGLLLAPAPELCTGCHERLYTCPAAPSIATSDCVPCHEPHGGERRFLRRDLARGAPGS